MKSKKPDYQLFKNWFADNGGKSRKIEFPTKFSPLDYVGVSAAQDINANEVFMAIPKKLIISVTRVRDSALGSILQKYECLNDAQNEQTDFNILTLYIIWQKMLGEASFYYCYFQAVEDGETIIQWTNEDIQKLKDPVITVQLIEQLRSQFPPVYKQFHQLSLEHPQIFKQPISWDLFISCYTIVMTRCFGWGLPQTMLVPYADFLNHNCQGVHHYILNKKLEEGAKHDPNYIIKRKQLDLTLLDIDNKNELPISYQLNQREKYIQNNSHLLQNTKYKNKYDKKKTLHTKQTKQYLQAIQQQVLVETYKTDCYPSSNSQDNDSEQQSMENQEIKQKIFSKQIKRLVDKQIERKFQEPKPTVNREFQTGVSFDWWDELDQNQSYFIVVAERHYEKGDQIFNSYGRRSNRFLLIWYGFTHFSNKYDSVVFRFWDDKTFERTGELLLVKSLSFNDWVQKLKLSKQVFQNVGATDDYRLKKDNICYELMAYLRLRVIKKNPLFKNLYSKRLITIHKIHSLQLQNAMLQQYEMVLVQLKKIYEVQKQRQILSNKYRDYFGNILISSNREILFNHCKGVRMLKNVLAKIGKGNKLMQIYRGSLLEEQDQLEMHQQEDKNRQKINYCKFRNRKFALDYFKMLDRHLKFQ